MTWSDFFNRPKYVFGLIATLLAIWLLLNPGVVNDLINRVILPLLMKLFVIGLMVWGIKVMIFGRGGGKK